MSDTTTPSKTVGSYCPQPPPPPAETVIIVLVKNSCQRRGESKRVTPQLLFNNTFDSMEAASAEVAKQGHSHEHVLLVDITNCELVPALRMSREWVVVPEGQPTNECNVSRY